MRWFVLIGLAICSSCGYRYLGEEKEGAATRSITVPYITGDVEGLLNNELVYQLSSSGKFQCFQSGGEVTLRVAWMTEEHDRIGFRYDRDNPSGRREKNLLGVEDRRSLTVEVSLLETSSQKILFGPSSITAYVDYDYTDPGSPRDQVLGRNDPVMQFSLGHLDSAEGAYDDASRPLFRKLSQKIVALICCNN